MDIGSAKIRPEEMDGVPHHLVDVLDPSEDFNVVLFQQMAKEAMEGIYERGNIPIVVGGTGFYIQALLYDIDFEKGIVYVDDKALDEPYVNAPTLTKEGVEFPVTVPEGHIFVMGDNRNMSTDSRSPMIGFIDVRYVLGKVEGRITPLGHWSVY